MKLTNFVDYSLRVLIYLAVHHNRICTAKEISVKFSVSYNHIVKIVHKLSGMGFINAQKGKGGGILLAKQSKEINIGEVVSTLEPDFNIVECFSSKGLCVITPVCKLKDILCNAHTAFICELNKYTLADVVTNKKDLLKILDAESSL